MSAEFLDARAAEQLMWQEEQTLPQSVIEAERLRAENGGAEVPSSSLPASQAASVPTAPAPRWPSLLMVLLARLRGEQPFENCSFCFTSDDIRDVCAEHLKLLDRLEHYGEAA